MGERKGTNLYYPPDYDPSKGGLNKWQGTHALRERARKLHMGILIIRFEMPYNIWCEGCGNHIGMGVRYNAEKKKVGMYYTTPVYQFRMKCHLCDNHFEIKTDPANLDYEIVSGARRQEKRFQAEDNETVVPDEKATINKLATDEMFKLEHVDSDKKKGDKAKPMIGKIYEIQDRVKDDYAANRALRDSMRKKRKASKLQSEVDTNLLKKSSLDLNLLPESELDKTGAALLRLAPALTPEERQAKQRRALDDRSIFDRVVSSNMQARESSKKQTIEDFKRSVSDQKRKNNQVLGLTANSLGIVKSKGVASSTATSSEATPATPPEVKSAQNVASNPTKELSLEATSNVSEVKNPLLSLSCDYGSSSNSSSDE